MTFLSPRLQREVDRRTASEQQAAETPEGLAALEAKVRHELDNAREASVLVESLGKLAMGSGTREYLTLALSTEHKTILGQIMAAVSMAVAPDEDKRELQPGEYRYCRRPNQQRNIIHADHDGRLTCETVIGATLARWQPII